MSKAKRACPHCGRLAEPDLVRCLGCGASLDAARPESAVPDDPEVVAARRHQQDSIEVKWIGVGVLLLAVFEAVPLLMLGLDGIEGLIAAIAAWFVGGAVVAFLSPGKTFVEPAISVVLCAVPTVAYLNAVSSGVGTTSLVNYVFGAFVGVLLSLGGTFVGEKLQALARPAGRA